MRVNEVEEEGGCEDKNVERDEGEEEKEEENKEENEEKGQDEDVTEIIIMVMIMRMGSSQLRLQLLTGQLPVCAEGAQR